MLTWRLVFIVLIALALPGASLADPAISRQGDNWKIAGPEYSVVLSGVNGSILSISHNGQGSIIASGKSGLWVATFSDKTSIAASSAGDGALTFSAHAASDGRSLDLRYAGPSISVVVTATPSKDNVNLQASVSASAKTILSFSLPGRLQFRPDLVDRFIAPMPAADSVGAQFNGRFFGPQPLERPAGYRPGPGSDAAYRALYGGPLNMRPVDDPPVAISVTPDGHKWLGETLASRLDGKNLVVNRAPAAGQYDLDLIDSANGPYLSASHLGGAGYIWRLAEISNDNYAGESRLAVLRVCRHLAQVDRAGRLVIGMIDLENGPSHGGWAASSVEDWRRSLQSDIELARAGIRIELLSTAGSVISAARSSNYLAILNPYGEYAPAPLSGGLDATIDAVRAYVRAGGNWFETGGYSFYYVLKPVKYFAFSDKYPSLFADFFHLDTHNGGVSIFRVAPINWAPFEGAANHDCIFVPGEAGFGGDDDGGYLDRSFATYVKPGQTWQTPAVRIKFGSDAITDIAEYSHSNGIDRSLSDKMPAPLFNRFKQSVLVKYGGKCSELLDNLQYLPRSVIVHFDEYLHGGFDKQYPDLLPPNPRFGTPQDLRKLIDTIRADGMLSMPYTNTSWWCDHPRGPTFLASGDAPLLKQEDGTPYHEKYNTNDGWTVCFWHPAVSDADLTDLRLFSTDYPVDIVFQDQTGARSWLYDFSPASPTPYAYTEGLISMARRDAQLMPLATECGWDRVVNCECEFCGLSWGHTEFPRDECCVFPLAEYIAHDKVAFIQHDLGQSTTDQATMTKLLALGFGFTFIERASSAGLDPQREWLEWLARIQKSVCARYIGQPLVSFSDSMAEGNPDSGEVIRAKYGPVKIVANLSRTTQIVDGKTLAASGFLATSPGMLAADIVNTAGDMDARYVLEGTGADRDLWVYAMPGSVVALPLHAKGAMSVQWDSVPVQSVEASQGTLTLTLPATHPRQSATGGGQTLYLWHARVEGF